MKKKEIKKPTKKEYKAPPKKQEYNDDVKKEDKEPKLKTESQIEKDIKDGVVIDPDTYTSISLRREDIYRLMHKFKKGSHLYERFLRQLEYSHPDANV